MDNREYITNLLPVKLLTCLLVDLELIWKATGCAARTWTSPRPSDRPLQNKPQLSFVIATSVSRSVMSVSSSWELTCFPSYCVWFLNIFPMFVLLPRCSLDGPRTPVSGVTKHCRISPTAIDTGSVSPRQSHWSSEVSGLDDERRTPACQCCISHSSAQVAFSISRITAVGG